MRSSPSIIPNDRLDRTIYLVLEDFSSGAAWRETGEDRTDYRTVVNDLLAGQYDNPLRAVAFIRGGDGRAMLPKTLPRSWRSGWTSTIERSASRCVSSSRILLAERSACSCCCRCASSDRARIGPYRLRGVVAPRMVARIGRRRRLLFPSQTRRAVAAELFA